MLKNFVLAAGTLAIAGSLSLAAPTTAEAGVFCTKSGAVYVANKPRFSKWCAKRTERAMKRADRAAKRAAKRAARKASRA